MLQTLFVSNLPSQMTDDELETIFARHGRVSRAWLRPAKDSKDNRGGRDGRGGARKSGYVEVHSDDAEQVIWIMNGSWYKTSCLDVQTEAERRRRDKEPRERAVYTAHRY